MYVRACSVSFAYSGDLSSGPVLFRDLDVAVDCDSRIALVGANGSGRKTHTHTIHPSLSLSLKTHVHRGMSMIHRTS